MKIRIKIRDVLFLLLTAGLAPAPGAGAAESGSTPGSAVPALPAGAVIYATGFEGDDDTAFAGWWGTAGPGPGYESAQSLFVERPPKASPTGGSFVLRRLPAARLRGCLLQFSGMVRAEKVTEKPNPWNGIKFMVPITTPTEKLWPQAEIGAGSFAWRRFVFLVRVPEDAEEVLLHLGLEAVGGKVWFDDLRVTVRRPPPAFNERLIREFRYKGHDLPKLRGTMVDPDIDEEGLRVLGEEWNANLIRWQLVRRNFTGDPLDMAAYDKWLQGELQKLDAALPLCEKYGLMVAIDLHSPPGGRLTAGGYTGADHGLFAEAKCQEKFVRVWEQIARRYKDTRPVWGYDLANEPVENVTAEGLADWQELAERAARAIRAVDPETAIIVQPPAYGGPAGMRCFYPIDVTNVVYSVHMYIPGAFTHQGVHGPWEEKHYPGEIDRTMWDKNRLAAALQPVVDFQNTYNVHIYIGEFGAVRWAPEGGAYRYLRDLIDIFEAHGWDWSYHAFREWQGWSVEIGSERYDTRPAERPTDRQLLLLEWFAGNQKPPWHRCR